MIPPYFHWTISNNDMYFMWLSHAVDYITMDNFAGKRCTMFYEVINMLNELIFVPYFLDTPRMRTYICISIFTLHLIRYSDPSLSPTPPKTYHPHFLPRGQPHPNTIKVIVLISNFCFHASRLTNSISGVPIYFSATLSIVMGWFCV